MVTRIITILTVSGLVVLTSVLSSAVPKQFISTNKARKVAAYTIKTPQGKLVPYLCRNDATSAIDALLYGENGGFVGANRDLLWVEYKARGYSAEPVWIKRRRIK